MRRISERPPRRWLPDLSTVLLVSVVLVILLWMTFELWVPHTFPE